MESNQQISQTLKALLAACRISEKGYESASQAMPGITIPEVLHDYAGQRKEFAEELQTEIRFHSGSFLDIDPPADSLRNILHAISKRNKKEIIVECERAEEAMIRIYEDSLSKQWPWDVYSVLTHQYLAIKEAHYFLNALDQINRQIAA